MSKHAEEPTTGQVLTQEQLAKRWDIDIRTLHNYRKNGTGPRYMLIGRSPRYLISEIEAYELSQQIDPATKKTK